MSAGTVIIWCSGILLMLSIKQVTSQCDKKKGDCVSDYLKETCKEECSRTPGDCKNYTGVDMFGKKQKYQCHCKLLSDCKFGNFSECKNGCLPGFKKPYCQKRRYHEFIKNVSNESPYLFSSDNKTAKKPRFVVQFRNKYRFSTVEIYSNFTDATMKVFYPSGMECESKRNKTVCTGNAKSNQLDINGTAGVYRIKLFGCPPGLYGKHCINECHCSRLESCHPITGVCPLKTQCHRITGICRYDCEDGWYGEKCDKQTYVNIAQGKQTNQSSTYGYNNTRVFYNGTCVNMKVGMTSDKAVDGNFDPGYTHGSCIHTEKERKPYWKVTFDKPYMISQLRIYNRMENLKKQNAFKVDVGSSVCKQNRFKENIIDIKCQKPVNSSYVKISLESEKGIILSLCEVEVLQCVTGFYGEMCKERCDECKDFKCDQFEGHCEEGCINGYYWYDSSWKCRKCSSGKFGEDCKMFCHCSGTCNHINGSCTGVCNAGYTGFNCQKECDDGRFGSNCTGICHCIDNKNCNKITGKCSDGCSDGYEGESCQHPCEAGKFGRDCKMSCHCSTTCNHINGSCPGVCDAGYKGFNCQEECEVGKFGSNCKFACHCIDNKNCNKTNGKCSDGCADGYKGHICEHECPNGTFGQNCSKSCGHCSLRCNHVNGSCPGDCEAGYSGINCQEECKGDRFGVNCKSSCHCSDNRECDRKNGTCPNGCADGYEGDSCQQECPNGKFGLGCKELCRCSEKCNNINGSCPGTCDEGYHGFRCQKEKPGNSLMLAVLVPSLLLILVIIGMVAVVCYRKCRGKRPIAKRDEKIRKIPRNNYTQPIPEDTANLNEEIQLNETEGIYVNVVCSSFKSNLQKYVSEKKKEVEPFNDEFLGIPQTLPLPCSQATKPENVKKNRYKTILPYDHSRVKLQPDEISSSDYINANFISNQRYIACQGPTENTVTDFWRMIWQYKCSTIVMLTDIVENGKVKCMQYWPDEENTESFGTIQVTHINTSYHSTYIHRCFSISKTVAYRNESWTIEHFYFSKWPDHGIPRHAEYILEFRNALRFREETSSSLVVHCSAGVGRTGTYICIDILLNEMRNGEPFDVVACVTKLRGDRMHMVQKRIQLEFIYDVLVENILTGEYDVDVNDIPMEFSRIKETDNLTRVSILEHQFQDVIKQVTVRDTDITLKDGEMEGDYVNFNISDAIIDGPSCEKEFLVTKSPNEAKVVEFLRCMLKRGYLNIVAFDSSEKTPKYMPRTLNETVKIGPYLLELINVEGKDVCIHSVLKVECDSNSRVEEFEINHFQVTIWKDGNYPSCSDILQLSNILRAHQDEQFNKKIAVYCRDNFYKSGLLCIVHILKAAITSQSVINIVRLVRLIKKIEPKIVPDYESYDFLWKVAEYLQNESSLYANFIQ